MLQIPTIHLNGTARSDLLNGYLQARAALVFARRTLCDTAPNGRDYYPQGDGAIGRALTQHAARLKAIDAIIDEIEEIATKISE